MSSESAEPKETDDKVVYISQYLAAEDAAVAMMESAARSNNKSAARLNNNDAARSTQKHTAKPSLFRRLISWLKPGN